MGSFTIPTELCQALLQWTGVQNLFPCGFPALDAADLLIQYTTATNPPVTTTLIPGVNVAVLLDALTGNVSLTPLAMPAPNGILTVTRITAAIQPTQFTNLEAYQADSQTTAFDRAMLVCAELKRRVAVLEGEALLQPGNFTFGIRQQRRIVSVQNLPIQLFDSILNFDVTSGALAVTLPPFAIRGGAPLTFRDVAGVAAANPITINRASASGTEDMDGQAAMVLNTNFFDVTLTPANDGASTGWKIS